MTIKAMTTVAELEANGFMYSGNNIWTKAVGEIKINLFYDIDGGVVWAVYVWVAHKRLMEIHDAYLWAEFNIKSLVKAILHFYQDYQQET